MDVSTILGPFSFYKCIEHEVRRGWMREPGKNSLRIPEVGLGALGANDSRSGNKSPPKRGQKSPDIGLLSQYGRDRSGFTWGQ